MSSSSNAADNAQIQDELGLLKRNASLVNQQSLIVNLLSMQEPENDSLNTFDKLVREDFWELSKALGQTTARQDYLTLSAITQELQMVVGSPDIHMKSIVGICGGFSSGKSALINSFIESSAVRLTEGVNPVTAVASYVTHRPTLQMRAYSKNGSSCELTQDHYKQLDHEAQKDSPIDLQRLLSCITIGLPMAHKEIFAELCLIDTPGYNPADFGTKTADHKTAHKFAKQSDALIWVVSAEQGTLPQSDIDFINDIKANGFTGKLYIVINKADLKSESDREIILQEVTDKLDFEFLDYEGISLYSSSRRVELGYYKQSLLEFLASCKTSKPISNVINKKIDAIFDKYHKLANQDKAWLDDINEKCKSLKLDVKQALGVDDSISWWHEESESTKQWRYNIKPQMDDIFDEMDIKFRNKICDNFTIEALRVLLQNCVHGIENSLKMQ